jgi:predicted DNA-binding protein
MTLTQRIELRVDDAFVDAPTELADRVGKTRAEVIRDALNHYSNDVYAWDKDHGIGEETT